MRITTSQLRRIIKEEAQRVLGTRRRAPVRRRRMFEGDRAGNAWQPSVGVDDMQNVQEVEQALEAILTATYGAGQDPSSGDREYIDSLLSFLDPDHAYDVVHDWANANVTDRDPEDVLDDLEIR